MLYAIALLVILFIEFQILWTYYIWSESLWVLIDDATSDPKAFIIGLAYDLAICVVVALVGTAMATAILNISNMHKSPPYVTYRRVSGLALSMGLLFLLAVWVDLIALGT